MATIGPLLAATPSRSSRPTGKAYNGVPERSYVDDLRYGPPVELGYARVSTAKQDLDRQVDALQQAGIAPERIYLDKKSGATTDRPGLQAALAYARSGDVIVVHTLDRLGRTVRDTLNLIHELAERGVRIRNLADPIKVDSGNPADPMAQLAVVLLALFAQMERTYILERAAHARAVATAKGRRIGRPVLVDPGKLAYAAHLRDTGYTVAEIVAKSGIARTSLYRHLPSRPPEQLTVSPPTRPADPPTAGRPPGPAVPGAVVRSSAVEPPRGPRLARRVPAAVPGLHPAHQRTAGAVGAAHGRARARSSPSAPSRAAAPSTTTPPTNATPCPPPASSPTSPPGPWRYPTARPRELPVVAQVPQRAASCRGTPEPSHPLARAAQVRRPATTAVDTRGVLNTRPCPCTRRVKVRTRR